MSRSAHYFGIFGKLCSTGLLNMIFHINLKVILTLNVNLSRILILMSPLSSVSWVRQSLQLSSQDTTLAGVNSDISLRASLRT